MDTHRIIINNIDYSTVDTNNTSSIYGATMIKTSKGPKKPVRVRGLEDLHTIFGKSDKSHISIKEAEDFLSSGYECYIGSDTQYFTEGSSGSEDTGSSIPLYEVVKNNTTYKLQRVTSGTKKTPESINYTKDYEEDLLKGVVPSDLKDNKGSENAIALILPKFPATSDEIKYDAANIVLDSKKITFKNLPVGSSFANISVYKDGTYSEDYYDQNSWTIYLKGTLPDEEKSCSSESVTFENNGRKEDSLDWKAFESLDINPAVFFDSEENKKSSDSFNGWIEIVPRFKYSGFIFNYSPEYGDNLTKCNPLLNGDISDQSRCWNVYNTYYIDALENYSPLTGSRAAMQCKIAEKRFGGVAPMWFNDTDNLGGELGISNSSKLKYHNLTKDKLRKLDEFNYNPIIGSPNSTCMIVSQKTCKEGALSDWSYIGHVASFILFQKEVEENVMLPQIGKANNDYYRNLRALQVQRLLDERITGANRIWASASVDTSTNPGVNDEFTQRARKFVISVAVKPDVFSEVVELNFVTENQAS